MAIKAIGLVLWRLALLKTKYGFVFEVEEVEVNVRRLTNPNVEINSHART